MTWLWDVSTVTGALPVVLSILGALGLAALRLRRDRAWWQRTICPAGAVENRHG